MKVQLKHFLQFADFLKWITGHTFKTLLKSIVVGPLTIHFLNTAAAITIYSLLLLKQN